jgi:hypothetical protein
VVRFIDSHKDRRSGQLRWGIEPIAKVLGVAPSTYHAAKWRFGSEGELSIPGAVQGPCDSGGSLRLQIREPLWKLTLRASASCWSDSAT